MKLTIERLKEIIREEIQNEVSDKDKHPGKGYYMSRRQRERERNAGLGGDRVRREPIALTDEEKETISAEIEKFLTSANDENSGWWPQTWLGGGRVWTGSEYVDRTPEQNAAMRKQFDDLRASSGRDPFTVDHIKQDIKQSGSSVWYADPKTRELKHPSLSAFIKSKLITKIYAALDASSGMEAENKLKAYLSALSEGERIHAPSPQPPRAKEKDDNKKKKRRHHGVVDHSVSHSDKVTGNMDDFGRIAEEDTLSEIVDKVFASVRLKNKES